MSRPILAVLLAMLALCCAQAQARVAQARIARVTTGVATLEQVRLRLDWPAGAEAGELQLWAGRVDAPDLGYRYRDLHWRCPLRRIAGGGWQCEGELRAVRAAPLRLAVEFDEAGTRASLSQGGARLALDRTAAAPDRVAFDLASVPLAWAQALLAQAWPEAHFKSGTVDGRLSLEVPAGRPLRLSGPLRLRGLGLETADAAIVGEGLGGGLRIDYRSGPALALLAVDGELRGGEFLVGNSYVALPDTPVGVCVLALKQAGTGWELLLIELRDVDVLQVVASLWMGTDGALQLLQAAGRSGDMAPLKPRYLSGWMALAGLGGGDLHGAADMQLQVAGGGLASFAARLHGVDLRDAAERFVFDGLQGELRYSATAPVRSELRWSGGKLYGLEFGAARLPFASEAGMLRIPGEAAVPLMDGRMVFHDLVIRPPQGGAGMDIRFGLALDDIDFGKVSRALGLPAFQGRLSGDIPAAHYADERLDFDGGLSMQLFDGTVRFSALSLERPFGSAPSLGADIDFDGLDLLRLTEVLGFGSIAGRLDGRIDGLRLVDWTP